MSKSKTLFLISGSIAAFKAAQVISRLVQEGHDVKCVMTPGALKFLGPATVEGLTGHAPVTGLWECGRAMEHIHLTRWADRAVLCPASANTIAKLAAGLADDSLSAVALAWPMEKPFYIFPAMNTLMLIAASTQANLNTLKARGFAVAETGRGTLACGETGEGRLPEPEEILGMINEDALPSRKGRVLVTAGATREPIDGIRFISNVSTGQTGAELADRLSAQGWQVTYLHGQGARLSNKAAHRLSFNDCADLERKLRSELDQRDYAAVIHGAAVSDFHVENAKPGVKLGSDAAALTLHLKPNPKLLPKLKSYSRNKNVKVIGFKLTLNTDPAERAAELLLDDNVDAVVANEWSQVENDRTRHPGCLVRRNGSRNFETLAQLAEELNDLMS